VWRLRKREPLRALSPLVAIEVEEMIRFYSNWRLGRVLLVLACGDLVSKQQWYHHGVVAAFADGRTRNQRIISTSKGISHRPERMEINYSTWLHYKNDHGPEINEEDGEDESLYFSNMISERPSEPLYDHDDWIRHRNNRSDESETIATALFGSFVVFLWVAALQL
jgi:hypothetical protein